MKKEGVEMRIPELYDKKKPVFSWKYFHRREKQILNQYMTLLSSWLSAIRIS